MKQQTNKQDITGRSGKPEQINAILAKMDFGGNSPENPLPKWLPVEQANALLHWTSASQLTDALRWIKNNAPLNENLFHELADYHLEFAFLAETLAINTKRLDHLQAVAEYLLRGQEAYDIYCEGTGISCIDSHRILVSADYYAEGRMDHDAQQLENDNWENDYVPDYSGL